MLNIAHFWRLPDYLHETWFIHLTGGSLRRPGATDDSCKSKSSKTSITCSDFSFSCNERILHPLTPSAPLAGALCPIKTRSFWERYWDCFAFLFQTLSASNEKFSLLNNSLNILNRYLWLDNFNLSALANLQTIKKN